MSIIEYKNFEIWFVTGSQHLYGEETLKQVAENSKHIVYGLNNTNEMFPSFYKNRIMALRANQLLSS